MPTSMGFTSNWIGTPMVGLDAVRRVVPGNRDRSVGFGRLRHLDFDNLMHAGLLMSAGSGDVLDAVFDQDRNLQGLNPRHAGKGVGRHFGFKFATLEFHELDCGRFH